MTKAPGSLRKQFERYAAQYGKALVGFLRTHLRNETDAEDLAQQVWLKAFAHFPKSPGQGGYDPAKGSYYTYLINRFAKYELLRSPARLRRKKRERLVAFQAEGEAATEEPADAGQPGADSIAQAAEELHLRYAAMTELFRLFFLCGGYPHQQLAAALSKHIYGQPSPRGIEGNSALVDARHGATPLKKLVDEYWTAYAAASQLDRPTLRRLKRYLKPVRDRLPLRAAALLALDPASLKQARNIRDSRVGATHLRQYYADRKGGFTTAIPDWCYKVERKIRDVLGMEDEPPAAKAVAGLRGGAPVEPRGCTRCKLRELPPCGRRSAGKGRKTARRA